MSATQGPQPAPRPVRAADIVGLVLGLVVFLVLAAASLGVLAVHAKDVQAADVAKVIIAMTALLFSLLDGLRATLRGRVPEPVKIVVGALLAVAAVIAYFNAFKFNYPNFYHRWEFYHSYVGAKYFRELGYDNLYRCTIVAQDELGTVAVTGTNGRVTFVDMSREARRPDRQIRNLGAGNLLAPASTAFDSADTCRAAFTPERWQLFKEDVKFFRLQSGRTYFEDMQKDHGFGMSPVWTIGGHLLASVQSTSVGAMQVLAFADLVFLLGVFGALWWGFGWRVSAVAATFWGCQAVSTFYWNGGAFLRYDWLFWLVLSVCLLRKRHGKLAGASLAYAALLSVFPIYVAAGLLLHAVISTIRSRRLNRVWVGAVLGAAIAFAVLVPASLLVCGKSAYSGFWDRRESTGAMPVTNQVGLAVVLSHDLGSDSESGRMKYARDNSQPDPFARWKQMRLERRSAMLPAVVVISLLLLTGFGLAAWRLRSPWASAALAPLLITLFTTLTCFHYPFLLLAATLTRLRRWLEVLLFSFAVITQLVAIGFYYMDDRYAALSVVTLLFCAALVAAFVRVVPRRSRPADRGQAA